MSQPNILFILTDQQHHGMMSCTGNPWVQTPHLDRLAAEGMRFTRAYCANPVCVPSRFSLFTGRMPGHIGMRSNWSKETRPLTPEEVSEGLGHLMTRAGYRAVYGGKEHFPVGLTAQQLGFDYFCADERWELSREVARFIRDDHATPWCMVASFINPHDICYHAIREAEQQPEENLLLRQGEVELANLDEALQVPWGLDEATFWSEYCPPLPSNHARQENEPEALRDLVQERKFRAFIREHWDERQWRMHRWAYARLTEQVDRQIGVVLRALRESGKAADTVVIFTSDHGDHDASHELEHKTAFYDEAVRIPFLMSQPGVIPPGVVNDKHMVNNGLDLMVTLCDYAGVESPNHCQGVSARPHAEGRNDTPPQTHVYGQNQISDMLCTHDWKYVEHLYGADAIQLYDLHRDPGETRNAALDPHCASVVEYHQALLAGERAKHPS